MAKETPKTRISQDVWDIAATVAERMGLSGERAAIEAIVRVFHSDYVLGLTPDKRSPGPCIQSSAVANAPAIEPDINCAADLNNLLDTL